MCLLHNQNILNILVIFSKTDGDYTKILGSLILYIRYSINNKLVWKILLVGNK